MEDKTVQLQEMPDEMLVNRILTGEKRLFESIIRRYNQRLYRIGLSILNSDVEAEDAMQTAYIKAYENLHKFENRSSFATWLTRIMLNESLAQKNKNQRFSTQPERELEKNIIMTTPAHIFMNKELSGVLEAAITRLPEKYRLVFVLREIEEMSIRETSETLSIEESNVKVRLNRAKAMLKEHLNGYMKDHVYSFHLTRCDYIVNKVLTHLRIV